MEQSEPGKRPETSSDATPGPDSPSAPPSTRTNATAPKHPYHWAIDMTAQSLGQFFVITGVGPEQAREFKNGAEREKTAEASDITASDPQPANDADI